MSSAAAGPPSLLASTSPHCARDLVAGHYGDIAVVTTGVITGVITGVTTVARQPLAPGPISWHSAIIA
ncbi:hypothetical protein GCM10011575_18750 [Microlunatus endophyticus]|uniref:Uncharacterized protein n=1 Tax=Microlunatus endophyticus TaxID=1716077 RepID=A0A917W3N6_9ACTN|nr:hypothetical protein GCM10011575_18750 [Microlunatus endophyticus]